MGLWKAPAPGRRCIANPMARPPSTGPEIRSPHWGGDAMIIYVHDRPIKIGRGFRYLTRAEALNCGL